MSSVTATHLTELREALCGFEKIDRVVSLEELTHFYEKILCFLQEYGHMLDNIKEVVYCILKYVDLIDDYTQYTSEITESSIERVKYFCNVVSHMFKSKSVCDAYIQEISEFAFERVTDPITKLFFATELLVNYNKVLLYTTKELRHQIIAKNKVHLYRLINQLYTCGDYVHQINIMETVFCMCSHQQITEYACHFFPESKELENAFLKIERKDFDCGVRIFLNVLNLKFRKVVSLRCNHLFLNEVEIFKMQEELCENQLWMHFNKGSNSIGVTSNDHRSPVSSLVVIKATNVEKILLSRLPLRHCPTEHDLEIQFNLKKPLVAHPAKYVKVVILHSPELEFLEKEVLPVMCNGKFQTAPPPSEVKEKKISMGVTPETQPPSEVKQKKASMGVTSKTQPPSEVKQKKASMGVTSKTQPPSEVKLKKASMGVTSKTQTPEVKLEKVSLGVTPKSRKLWEQEIELHTDVASSTIKLSNGAASPKTRFRYSKGSMGKNEINSNYEPNESSETDIDKFNNSGSFTVMNYIDLTVDDYSVNSQYNVARSVEQRHQDDFVTTSEYKSNPMKMGKLSGIKNNETTNTTSQPQNIQKISIGKQINGISSCIVKDNITKNIQLKLDRQTENLHTKQKDVQCWLENSYSYSVEDNSTKLNEEMDKQDCIFIELLSKQFVEKIPSKDIEPKHFHHEFAKSPNMLFKVSVGKTAPHTERALENYQQTLSLNPTEKNISTSLHKESFSNREFIVTNANVSETAAVAVVNENGNSHKQEVEENANDDGNDHVNVSKIVMDYIDLTVDDDSVNSQNNACSVKQHDFVTTSDNKTNDMNIGKLSRIKINEIKNTMTSLQNVQKISIGEQINDISPYVVENNITKNMQIKLDKPTEILHTQQKDVQCWLEKSYSAEDNSLKLNKKMDRQDCISTVLLSKESMEKIPSKNFELKRFHCELMKSPNMLFKVSVGRTASYTECDLENYQQTASSNPAENNISSSLHTKSFSNREFLVTDANVCETAAVAVVNENCNSHKEVVDKKSNDGNNLVKQIAQSNNTMEHEARDLDFIPNVWLTESQYFEPVPIKNVTLETTSLLLDSQENGFKGQKSTVNEIATHHPSLTELNENESSENNRFECNLTCDMEKFKPGVIVNVVRLKDSVIQMHQSKLLKNQSNTLDSNEILKQKPNVSESRSDNQKQPECELNTSNNNSIKQNNLKNRKRKAQVNTTSIRSIKKGILSIETISNENNEIDCDKIGSGIEVHQSIDREIDENESVTGVSGRIHKLPTKQTTDFNPFIMVTKLDYLESMIINNDEYSKIQPKIETTSFQSEKAKHTIKNNVSTKKEQATATQKNVDDNGNKTNKEGNTSNQKHVNENNGYKITNNKEEIFNQNVNEESRLYDGTELSTSINKRYDCKSEIIISQSKPSRVSKKRTTNSINKKYSEPATTVKQKQNKNTIFLNDVIKRSTGKKRKLFNLNDTSYMQHCTVDDTQTKEFPLNKHIKSQKNFNNTYDSSFISGSMIKKNRELNEEDKFDKILTPLQKKRNKNISLYITNTSTVTAVDKTCLENVSMQKANNKSFQLLMDSHMATINSMNASCITKMLNKSKAASRRRKSRSQYEGVTMRQQSICDNYESVCNDQNANITEYHKSKKNASSKTVSAIRRKGKIYTKQKIASKRSLKRNSAGLSSFPELSVEKEKPKMPQEMRLTDSNSHPSVEKQIKVAVPKVIIHSNVCVKEPGENNTISQTSLSIFKPNYEEHNKLSLPEQNGEIKNFTNVSQEREPLELPIIQQFASLPNNIITSQLQSVPVYDFSAQTSESKGKPNATNEQILTWVATGLQEEAFTMVKNVSETTLRAFREIIKVQLGLLRGGVHPSLVNLYEVLVEIDNIIAKYFKSN